MIRVKFPVQKTCVRYFSVSACSFGKKTRTPFDKRFPVTAKHTHRKREGGSERLEEITAKHVVQRTGLYSKDLGKFRNVKEMIPEFIVPDLQGFKLKPYVSYKVPEVTQTKLTAKDLFNSCYADKIAQQVQEGKITLENCTSDLKEPGSEKS